jgi:hypothetical protein
MWAAAIFGPQHYPARPGTYCVRYAKLLLGDFPKKAIHICRCRQHIHFLLSTGHLWPITTHCNCDAIPRFPFIRTATFSPLVCPSAVTMPSDPFNATTDNTHASTCEEPTDSSCWICFGECDATAVLCRCPDRVAHPLCLSKWQLTRVGTR